MATNIVVVKPQIGPQGPAGAAIGSSGTGFLHFTGGVPDSPARAVNPATAGDMSVGAANTVLTSNGTVGVWTTLVNANISAGAAIAVSKLAPGTNTFVLTTTGGVAVWAAAPAAFVPPTGTGFVTVTAGALDAASLAYPLGVAKGGLGVITFAVAGVLHSAGGAAAITSSLLVNADVAGGAAIAASKLAPPGATTNVVTNQGGAFAADSSFTYNAAGGATLTAFLKLGASTYATTGELRFPNAFTGIMGRDVSNASDMCLMTLTNLNRVHIGCDAGFGSMATSVFIFPSTSVSLGINGGNYVDLVADQIRCYKQLKLDDITAPTVPEVSAALLYSGGGVVKSLDEEGCIHRLGTGDGVVLKDLSSGDVTLTEDEASCAIVFISGGSGTLRTLFYPKQTGLQGARRRMIMCSSATYTNGLQVSITGGGSPTVASFTASTKNAGDVVILSTGATLVTALKSIP